MGAIEWQGFQSFKKCLYRKLAGTHAGRLSVEATVLRNADPFQDLLGCWAIRVDQIVPDWHAALNDGERLKTLFHSRIAAHITYETKTVRESSVSTTTWITIKDFAKLVFLYIPNVWMRCILTSIKTFAPSVCIVLNSRKTAPLTQTTKLVTQMILSAYKNLHSRNINNSWHWL